MDLRAAALGLVLSMGTALVAADPPAIDPDRVESLAIEPGTILLPHSRSIERVLATAVVQGQPVDATDQVQWTLADESIARIIDPHDIVPVADGETEIVATLGSHSARAVVRVSGSAKARTISFTNEIEPILSKLSCNSGGCHGKSGGQNGFRLSLLAYQPDADFNYIVVEGRGRRLSPAAPEHSLFLRKATGELPHGGGKRMVSGDANHQLIVAWIKQGMPYGESDTPVARIEISPTSRVMARGATQRLRVVAHYADGTSEDVTRQVQFQSNDEAVARVSNDGQVSVQDQSGESAIMARYMGQVAVFRATVPVGLPMPESVGFVAHGLIDEQTSRKWKELGLVPSRPTTDAEFVRRIHIDLCGRLPTIPEVASFLASSEVNKRERLIDELLQSSDFASHFAMKWGAILQNQRAGRADFAPGTHAMSLWLKDAFAQDMPYDRMARAIITASGVPESNPPVTWYRQVRTPEQNVDNITQLFLGTRLQCAQCHHHPFEKWGQDDYYGLAAFFSRVGRKPFSQSATGEPVEAVFVARSGNISHPVTRAEVKPQALDGAPLDIPAGEDPRVSLADWMTASDNPYFARALVNRMWGHFFHRGIVEPVDDMRVTNPPTNPELLDALARDFVEHGYSIHHLIRSIVTSSTYQLSSEPNEFNRQDQQNFARYYPRRLAAEVLLDAIDMVTEVRTNFGFPQEMRAVDLPDEQIGSYFLDVFGRPQRQSSCECERTDSANLSQALHLLNSPEIQGKLTAAEGRAAHLAADVRPDDDKIRELYLLFFARPPSDDERKVAIEYLGSRADKKVAYENLIWALINTKEFQFSI